MLGVPEAARMNACGRLKPVDDLLTYCSFPSANHCTIWRLPSPSGSETAQRGTFHAQLLDQDPPAASAAQALVRSGCTRHQAAERHAPERVHQRNHRVGDDAAHVVEVAVDSVRTQPRQRSRVVGRRLVVERAIEAELIHEIFHLLVGPCDADGAAADDSSPSDRPVIDGAGRASRPLAYRRSLLDTHRPRRIYAVIPDIPSTLSLVDTGAAWMTTE